MIFYELSDNEYQSKEGWRIMRERQSNVEPWVMRNATGEMVDSGFYINDIAERNKVTLISELSVRVKGALTWTQY